MWMRVWLKGVSRIGGTRDAQYPTMSGRFLALCILAMILSFPVMGTAAIVELDLISLGCHQVHDFNSPAFTSDFDLGVTFSGISNLYIDWAGEITAALTVDDDGGVPTTSPLDVGLLAMIGHFGHSASPRGTMIVGGSATYPDPEPFDCQSEFWSGTMPWSELFDGQSRILIEYTAPGSLVWPSWHYVEHGSVYLDRAALVVEGTIVPEPAAIWLLGATVFILRSRKRKA